FKGRAELLVRWSFEGGRVMVAADHADRFIAELRQDVLVGMRAAGDHRQPALEATGSVRIREKQRPTPQRQDKECVGLLLDLAEVWSVVLHFQRDPELLDDLTSIVFKGLMKPSRDLPSERVIERENRHLLIAEDLGRILAKRMHVSAGREARSDQPLGPLALGEIVSGVDRIDRRDPL